jgi:hypothetical protein
MTTATSPATRSIPEGERRAKLKRLVPRRAETPSAPGDNHRASSSVAGTATSVGHH